MKISDYLEPWDNIPFEALLFHTITHVEANNDDGYRGDDEIIFTLAPHPDIPNGLKVRMYHDQECCEFVQIEDITGDWQDILNQPITLAEAVTDTTSPKSGVNGDYTWTDDSSTWTFYKLGTPKGYVTIRWYGSSNGYYSEDVDLKAIGI